MLQQWRSLQGLRGCALHSEQLLRPKIQSSDGGDDGGGDDGGDDDGGDDGGGDGGNNDNGSDDNGGGEGDNFNQSIRSVRGEDDDIYWRRVVGHADTILISRAGFLGIILSFERDGIKPRAIIH